VSDVIFHNPEMLNLLLAVPVVAILHLYALHRRRRALGKFASARMLGLLTCPRTSARITWKMAAGCLAFAMAVIALARPAWNVRPRQLRRTGRDVVFVLDVSKSMSARDAAPNRLQRARTAILDCIEQLRGDRVGLVAFAGEAAVRCPLTLDYAFFRMVLEDTDHRSVATGGTRIGDAIETTVSEVLTEGKHGFRDVVLITDGEDHDSSPSQAATKLIGAGARLIAIGIGDDVQGRRIPLGGRQAVPAAFMTYEEREVWSRLEAATLRDMVARTRDGVYVHAATGAIDLPGIYRRVIASAEARRFESQTILQYEEKFQVFLAAGLMVLVISLVVAEAKQLPPARGISLLVVLAAVLSAGDMAAAGSPRRDFAAGGQAYAKRDYAAAAESYRKALTEAPGSAEVLYNLGSALYRNGDLSEAREAFTQAASLTGNETLKSRCLYNLGNCLFKLAGARRGDDARGALQFYRISARHYRTALDIDPRFRRAAFNMELARKTEKTLDDELKAARNEALQRLAEIKKKLIELIRRQEAVRTACGKPASDVPSLTAEQEALAGESRQLAEKIRAAAAAAPQLPASMQSEGENLDLGFDAARGHVLAAASAQDGATGSLRKASPTGALDDQARAIEELKRALKALPSDSKKDRKQDRDGETKRPRDGDPKKGERRKTEKSDRPADQVRPAEMDPDGEQFTAPLKTPEDILAEEKRNNVLRAKKRPLRAKLVDKDW